MKRCNLLPTIIPVKPLMCCVFSLGELLEKSPEPWTRSTCRRKKKCVTRGMVGVTPISKAKPMSSKEVDVSNKHVHKDISARRWKKRDHREKQWESWSTLRLNHSALSSEVKNNSKDAHMKIRQTFAGSSAHVSETSKDFLHLAQHASHFQNRFHPFVGEIPVSVRKKKHINPLVEWGWFKILLPFCFSFLCNQTYHITVIDVLCIIIYILCMYIYIYTCMFIYIHIYNHPEVDSEHGIFIQISKLFNEGKHEQ